MNKRKIRDSIRLFGALFFIILYLPHLFVYFCLGKKRIINSDIERLKKQLNIALPNSLAFLYFLHNNSYYRSVFYHRIGPELSLLIGWWRPRNKYFIIPGSTTIGGGILFAHPYATVLNAEKIGNNFSCIHCTTIGKKGDKRPTIGDNVSLGCNVTIIGGVHIGNNVTVGAGSVVLKDVPDNCIVAGNPAKVLRFKDEDSGINK